jgi:hypothetical protein
MHLSPQNQTKLGHQQWFGDTDITGKCRNWLLQH